MQLDEVRVSAEQVAEVLDQVERWEAQLVAVHARFAQHFSRSEPRARALEYMRGLIAPLERKNGWTLAEMAGQRAPDSTQHLLNRVDWDADAVRDQVRAFAVEHLGDVAGVLVGDETGFLKKGVRSAGVQRQYTGTAGRRENCQIGTFLTYASARGHTLIDRELYVPDETWIADRERCRGAGIGDQVQFATKPAQLRAKSELGFLPDGRGWSAWYNACALCVTRFQWSCPQPGLLELHTQWMVEGTSASQPGRPEFATTQPPEPVDEVTRHHYTIGEAVPMPGALPLPALLFQEPVEFARKFERGPREITPEDDPSHRILPYTRI